MAFNLTDENKPGSLASSIPQVFWAAGQQKAADEETPTAFGYGDGSPRRFAGERLGPPYAGLGGDFGAMASQGGPVMAWHKRSQNFSPVGGQASGQGVA